VNNTGGSTGVQYTLVATDHFMAPHLLSLRLQLVLPQSGAATCLFVPRINPP
jgi:hypothetical protein